MCAKAVALAARPEGMPKTSDFQIVDIESDDPADGEIQVKNICMSVDPYTVSYTHLTLPTIKRV